MQLHVTLHKVKLNSGPAAAESGHTAAGSTQIIRGGRTAVESAFGIPGVDVPPSGSPMFTPGGRTAIRHTVRLATVAGSGYAAPQRS